MEASSEKFSHSDIDVLSVCPVSLFMLDPDGRITFANKRARSVFGLEIGQVEGKMFNSPDFRITDLHGRLIPDEQLPFAKVMVTGEEVTDDLHVVESADGSRRILSVNAVPSKDVSGDITSVLCSVMDITQQLQLRQQTRSTTETYKKLFENLLDEVHLWQVVRDGKGEITGWTLIDANPSALFSWRKARSNVIGRSAAELFGDEAYEQFMPVVKHIMHTQTAKVWEQYFEPTNQYLAMTSIPIGDMFISTGRDITTEKLTEKRLIEAKNKAEEASRIKTEFLNNVSHEIRTPMNGIIGFSEFLNNPDLTQEQIKEFTGIINGSAKQLLRIVDEILEMSEVDSMKEASKLSRFRLNDLLHEEFSVIKMNIEKKDIAFIFNPALHDDASEIVSDPKLVRRIVKSLLENAYAYTLKGSIDLSYVVEADMLKLSVKDSGVGISPLNIARIFERFSKVSSEKLFSKQSGLGLGLSIAQESAALLGGTITVQSEEGKGSVFTVALPYRVKE